MAGNSLVLLDQISYLIDNLGDPRWYFNAFTKVGILTVDQCEAIKSEPSTEHCTEQFIRAVAESDKSYRVICGELKRQKTRAWIATHLRKCLNDKKKPTIPGSASPPEYTPPPPFSQAPGHVGDTIFKNGNRDDYHAAMKPPLSLPKDAPQLPSPPLKKDPVLESTPHSHTRDLSNVPCHSCGLIASPSMFEKNKDLNGVPLLPRDGPRVAPIPKDCGNSGPTEWVCSHCSYCNSSSDNNCQRCLLNFAFSAERYVDGFSYVCVRCELDVNVYRTIPEKINSALITYQICYKCYIHQKSQTSNNNSCDPGDQRPRQSASEPNLTMTPGDPSSVVHNEGDDSQTQVPIEELPVASRNLKSKPRISELQLLKHAQCDKRVTIIPTVAPEWTRFGDHLDFDADGTQLSIIKATFGYQGPVVCCREMFIFWLQGNGESQPPTWEKLIDLLGDADYGELADKVRCLITSL